MAKLLVAGGLNEEDDPAGARTRFAAALGRQIIRRGHTLLGGCRTGLDSVVAKAAFDAATSKPADPRKVIRSWVTGSTQPSHAYGEIMRSQLGDWALIPRGFAFPEPIQEADAVVIVGGMERIMRRAGAALLVNPFCRLLLSGELPPTSTKRNSRFPSDEMPPLFRAGISKS
jgi:hypothetical protein